MRTHFILYVSDQKASAKFYSCVLGLEPSLDVPGMTEFHLSETCVLGVMPASGVTRLLGETLPPPPAGDHAAKAELYFVVEDAGAFHARALACGARELSPLARRDWGHEAGYSLDRDGHVLAFAQIAEGGG